MGAYSQKLMSILATLCLSLTSTTFNVSAENERLLSLEPHSAASITTILPDDKPLEKGDINGDQKVDLRDVRAVLVEYTYTFIGLPTTMNDSQKNAADINSDEKIDLRDTRLVLKYYTYNNVSKLSVTWDDVINEKVTTTLATTATTSTTSSTTKAMIITTTSTVTTTKTTATTTIKTTTTTTTTTTQAVVIPQQGDRYDYVCNIKSMVFHYPHCSSVSRMNESNKYYVTWTRAEAIAAGYQPCGRCNP